jgi:hypothetical protein
MNVAASSRDPLDLDLLRASASESFRVLMSALQS